MLKYNNLKVCIVATSLSNGGTERFATTLSFILEGLGVEVSLLITRNAVDYPYAGKLYCLETLCNSTNTVKKTIAMYQFFKSNQFHVIIDNRARPQFFKELLIYRLVYKAPRIISMVHNYNVANYFPGSKQMSSLVYGLNHEFIGVSKAIKYRIIEDYGFNNVNYIYNPISVQNLKTKSFEFTPTFDNPYILYFGRLEEHSKNLTHLIRSYKHSSLQSKRIKLVIMGKGEDLPVLQHLVTELSLEEDVLFKPYHPNPFPYIRTALFTVLSSNYEGFPMSIIESLAIGTPVVSVDCKSGPSEIIKNAYNGLLVENHNTEKLAQAFDLFTTDNALYTYCKNNAINSVAHLDLDCISKTWKKLICK